MTKPFVYLDNSATTMPYPQAVEAMKLALTECWGNPSSAHQFGLEAELMVRQAREKIAGTLSCKPQNICFTSGGTESNNLALFGAANAMSRRGRHIITFNGEHKAVLNPIKRLRELGFEVDFLPLTQGGFPDLDALEAALRPDTILVSCMLVNNELGSVSPIAQISELIRTKSPIALLHTDAVQGFFKFPLSVGALGADLISISAHKFHGPKGIGALYISDRVGITPILYGGGQESKLRSGTENTAGIVGMGKACEIAGLDITGRTERLSQLKKYLRQSLENITGVIINTPEEHTAPHILSVSLPGLPSEVILHSLEARDIYVSAGSACSSRDKKTSSYVLTSAGIPKKLADSAIRVSFGDFNTIEDCDRLIDALKSLLSSTI